MVQGREGKAWVIFSVAKQQKEEIMQRTMRRIVIGLLAIGLLGGQVVFAQQMPGTKQMQTPGAGMAPPKAMQDPSKAMTDPTKTMPVDINTADEAALTSLKGIGPEKAKAIVQYRQEKGGFKTVDELKNVPGIGDKTLETLRPLITVGKMAQ
jgi:comEA protein